MVKIRIHFIAMVSLIFLVGIAGVEAGTKDLDPGKRIKFEDDSAESMKDVIERRETEEKTYRATMLQNSMTTIALLTEIRDLLMKLNLKP